MTADNSTFQLNEHMNDQVIRTGSIAPDFTARSTKGPIRLSNFRGQWVVFFSHPGAFTPVCTSEFVALSRASDKFAALKCQLLGHSIDSLFAHLAWVRAIHHDFDIEVNFPIVEDPSLAIAHAYSMVDSNSTHAASVRACYFIDPEGRIAAMTCYPATVGRSVSEILRVLEALQRAHSGTVMTPADWLPGDDVLAVPSIESGDMAKNERQTAWFYALMADPQRNGR